VRVTASDSPVPGGRLENAGTIAAQIATLPGVDEAVPMRTTTGEIVFDRRLVPFSLTGIDAGRRHPWTIIKGDDLAQAHGTPAPPLVVNQTLLDEIGLPLGSEVRVRVSCDAGRAAPTPRPFTVVGIAQFPFDDEAQSTAVMTRTMLRDACGDDSDVADMVLVASSGGAAAAVTAIRRVHPDLFVFTNEQIVARMQAQGFTYFRQISTVLSTITLLFGFLLITVLLTVSVNQRLAEIAALRALGFSRSRAAADVLVQGAMLVGTGGLLALPLGMALSLWLDRILKAMPGIPAAMHFFVFEPRALALHAALLATTALLASSYPMWLVARLPIAATLRNEVVG
jgi:ABC-type lipoprotein release transport system permease subunit